MVLDSVLRTRLGLALILSSSLLIIGCVTPDPVVNPPMPPQEPTPIQQDVNQEARRDVEEYLRTRREVSPTRPQMVQRAEPGPGEGGSLTSGGEGDSLRAEVPKYEVFFEPEHYALAQVTYSLVKMRCHVPEDTDTLFVDLIHKIGTGTVVHTDASEIRNVVFQLANVAATCSDSLVIFQTLLLSGPASRFLEIALNN